MGSQTQTQARAQNDTQVLLDNDEFALRVAGPAAVGAPSGPGGARAWSESTLTSTGCVHVGGDGSSEWDETEPAARESDLEPLAHDTEPGARLHPSHQAAHTGADEPLTAPSSSDSDSDSTGSGPPAGGPLPAAAEAMAGGVEPALSPYTGGEKPGPGWDESEAGRPPPACWNPGGPLDTVLSHLLSALNGRFPSHLFSVSVLTCVLTSVLTTILTSSPPSIVLADLLSRLLTALNHSLTSQCP